MPCCGHPSRFNFGDTTGIWIYRDTGTWQFLHSINSTAAVMADVNADGRDEIVMSVSQAGIVGLWEYYPATATWRYFNGWQAQAFTAGDLDGGGKSDVVIDFGTNGLWFWKNDTTWQYVHNLNPAWMSAGDMDGNGKADVVVNFSGQNYIWQWRDTGTWQLLHNLATTTATMADINGDGRAELVATVTQTGFGGLWEYYPGVAMWRYFNGWQAESMQPADVDANGMKDLIVDFGVNGLWLWKNDIGWQFLHGLNPAVTVGAHFGQALMADTTASPLASASLVTYSDLSPIVVEARRRLSLVDGQEIAEALDRVTVELADLADGVLGETVGSNVRIDRDAAGYGWFIDPTPTDDVEYLIGDRAASHRMDLLTAVMHEMGHTLGLSDLDGSVDGLMSGRLRVGVRRK